MMTQATAMQPEMRGTAVGTFASPFRPGVERVSHPSSFWQVVTLPVASRIPASAEEEESHRRFDGPHALQGPKLLLSWRTDVGFHQPLSANIETIPPQQLAQTGSQPSPTVGAKVPPDPAVSQAVPEESALPVSVRPDRDGRLANLLAEAAHDVRSPIATASQILATVVDRVRDSLRLTRGELDLLETANQRLVQANNWAAGVLLDRSLEHGMPLPIRSRFFPHQWLEMLQPMLEAVAAQRSVRLNWVGWDRSLPRLYLDANHLSRAILNLTTNAVQASLPGDEISIRVDWQRNVSQRLVIAIEDHGRGLSPELVREINAEPTSDQAWQYSGGIGLKTSKSLIKGLGGTVSAQRTDGGTLFRVTLPVDNPVSMVRAWLQQNASGVVDQAGESTVVAQIHAVKVQSLDFNFADRQLQTAAGVAQVVYRVAQDRWLWLELTSTAGRRESTLRRIAANLNDTAQGGKHCLTRMVYASESFDLQVAAKQSRQRLMSMAQLLGGKIGTLMGGRVPTVDDLEERDRAVMVRSNRRPEHLRSIPLQANRALVRADRSSLPEPHLTVAKQIREAGISPGKNLTAALTEIAQQWHNSQNSLNRVHHLAPRIAPPPH